MYLSVRLYHGLTQKEIQKKAKKRKNCTFVNDVRLEKEERVTSFGGAVLLTEGGHSPTEVSKTGRPPAPAAFDWAISSQELTLEYCWNDTDIVSFGFADHRMSRNSGDYRNVLDHYGGYVLPFRCAKVFLGEELYARCAALRIKHQPDESDLSFAYG